MDALMHMSDDDLKAMLIIPMVSSHVNLLQHFTLTMLYITLPYS